MSDQGGALHGLVVLDLSHVMAGPAAGRMLADMGADVIKVESPQGDDSRRMVPPSINGESAAFMMMNRNKRGIVLDFKSQAGKEALRRLVAKVDVLIENYRPGTMQKLGLGYAELAKINPRLIYLSISGFGLTGPLASQGGYDLIAQGMSGLMSITGEAEGRPPVKVGAPACDIVAGLLGTIGVLGAVAYRQRTGQGQLVDTSLFEAGVTLTYWQSAIALATGDAAKPLGSAHPLTAPYQAFQTADGWINIGAGSDKMFRLLSDVVGHPELVNDPRFLTNKDRMKNLPELVEVLTSPLTLQSSAHWLEKLALAGIPCGPVLTINEMLDHPQTAARDMRLKVEHPVAGSVDTLGFPIRFSGSPAKVQSPAPTHGQHQDEILSGMGFSAAEIAALAPRASD
jgi:crotonobetainyl-CoA:carnitine CoA-transferase CaiB-like acyl-CoA transferase